MPTLPSMPSNTPGEGNPSSDKKRKEREARVAAAKKAGELHLKEHYMNAMDKFHKENDAWLPENPKKPLVGVKPKGKK